MNMKIQNISSIVFWTPAETDPIGRQTPASLSDDKIMAKDFPNDASGWSETEIFTGMWRFFIFFRSTPFFFLFFLYLCFHIEKHG